MQLTGGVAREGKGPAFKSRGDVSIVLKANEVLGSRGLKERTLAKEMTDTPAWQC